jgi:hypothetical protein
MVVEPEEGPAEYEPFTPGAYYFLASVDTRVSEAGTYHVAVHSPVDGGAFGLAIGYREEFTLTEWLLLPPELMSIYVWEGQSGLQVLGPPVAVLAVGMSLTLWYLRRRGMVPTVRQWAGLLAGLLILAWTSVLVVQMTHALDISGWSDGALVTLVFLLVDVSIGLLAVMTALGTDEGSETISRARYFVVAAVALGLYAGFVAGPFLALFAALVPTHWGEAHPLGRFLPAS